MLQRLRARAGTQEFQDFKEWLTLQLEETKNNLVTSTPDTFQKLQGEAAMLQKLIRLLERRDLQQNTNGDA